MMLPLFIVGNVIVLLAAGVLVVLARRRAAGAIAAQEHTERLLHESDLRFRIVTRATNEAVWDWNIDTNAVWWNRNVQTLFGYSQEEVGLTDDWWIENLHPENRPQVVAGVQGRLRSNEEFWTGEYRFRRADGSYTDIRDRAYILRDETGRAVRMIGSMMDISEHKREVELARSRDAAIESARLKAQFLANMSHEIRTPLNSVIGMTDILSRTELTAEQREFTEIVRNSGEGLLAIINDILDFSKIEAGKLQFESVDFNPREIVDDVVALLAEQAKRKTLRLSAVVTPNTPSVVRGDPGRLRQVLTNLVSNAIKFTPQGEIMLRVRLDEETNAFTTLRFEVVDTGIGIPEEARACLFRPFSQVDASTTRKYGGTGLGLAISKQLIQLMNGEIGVASMPDKGSTFWFTAQFEKGNAAVLANAAAQPLVMPELTAETRQHKRVLVAEDNVFNQKVVARQFRDLGLAVDVVANGLEVLDAMERIPYDLVLMDCQMPEMDGYAATAEIRRREGPAKHTPVIAMTAHVLQEDRDRCLAAGMDDFLSKPVRLAQLQQALARSFGLSSPAVPAAAVAGNGNGHDDEQIVDLEVFDEMAGKNPQRRKELGHRYVEQTSGQLGQLKIAIANGIAGEVKRIAHSATGSSAMCGMVKLTPLLRELEGLGRNGQLTAAAPVYEQAEKEFERIKTFFQGK